MPSQRIATLGRVAYAQQHLLGDFDRSASLAASTDENGHEYGAVFTRRWVVELILDLAGYTSDRDLAAMRAVEPACGSGAFLGPMVERLALSCRAHGPGAWGRLRRDTRLRSTARKRRNEPSDGRALPRGGRLEHRRSPARG